MAGLAEHGWRVSQNTIGTPGQRNLQLGEAVGGDAADAAAHAATAYARQGRRALTAAATAERLTSACGGARTPALREALQPSPLTTREREIVTFAAQGMSNRGSRAGH